jgi:hypothetical protein
MCEGIDPFDSHCERDGGLPNRINACLRSRVKDVLLPTNENGGSEVEREGNTRL